MRRAFRNGRMMCNALFGDLLITFIASLTTNISQSANPQTSIKPVFSWVINHELTEESNPHSRAQKPFPELAWEDCTRIAKKRRNSPDFPFHYISTPRLLLATAERG
ncbi:hypothetical protein VC83_03348 [Pseudogymnoascus destructans]|uniref:Secreted protein n=1 Tax=Pseudogymnoascus destructans TaxID=655981 RepID=A0A177AEF0_9PEZI|nr:uncharacterized protein VC83_03348 [Pseudogymnoascus destructans]OAF60485.1 hypothetical protein VC83_03348 [Pseudogymnoascus destructans]